MLIGGAWDTALPPYQPVGGAAQSSPPLPGKKGRRFLDKRRDVLHTFKVVSRSQRDPLVADPEAPQAVLHPTQDTATNKSEQEKYGIFFDDDYDYLQHLRGVREAVNWDEEELEVYTIRCEDPQVEVSDEEGKERWDCETILTMNSTLYNHPRTITDPPRRKKIAVDPRTGIPLEQRVSGLTRRNLAHHDKAADTPDNEVVADTQTLITSMSAISIRPPGETTEERRFRKKALKELRRVFICFCRGDLCNAATTATPSLLLLLPAALLLLLPLLSSHTHP
ncbi:Protein LTV1 [Portunus trituberculatus]|uniref:Protein LTV1 homolog n=1 Tax=Portunus trituberculatus TaxID=210409 RepID=A0A5B7ESP9_PORTR|nr:Protein LTV1 [Portunus trituberculatus]